MLSYPGCQVTSLYEIASKRIQGLLEAYFNIKKSINKKLNEYINKISGKQENESIICVRVG